MGHVGRDSKSGLLVLEMLRRHCPHWVGIEAFQFALGLSSEVIHSHIKELRDMGHIIEGVPRRGFRLLGHPATLGSELIESGLGTERIGTKVLVYESTESTNDIAWQYSVESGYDGLSVFSEYQRSGRGRMGRTWSAPRGSSILCSVLLKDERQVPSAWLTLLAGLATAISLEKQTGLRIGIHWPNDVIIAGRKIAGTIVESRSNTGGTDYVIGVGINCGQREQDFPDELRATATSVREATGCEIDRLSLAQELLRQLDYWIAIVKDEGVSILHREWSTRCSDIGRRITVSSDRQSFSGRVVDVDPEQGLLLQLDSGPVKVFQGATTTVVQRS